MFLELFIHCFNFFYCFDFSDVVIYPLRPFRADTAPSGQHCFSFADTPGYTALLKQFVGVLRTTRRM